MRCPLDLLGVGVNPNSSSLPSIACLTLSECVVKQNDEYEEGQCVSIPAVISNKSFSSSGDITFPLVFAHIVCRAYSKPLI